MEDFSSQLRKLGKFGVFGINFASMLMFTEKIEITDNLEKKLKELERIPISSKPIEKGQVAKSIQQLYLDYLRIYGKVYPLSEEIRASLSFAIDNMAKFSDEPQAPFTTKPVYYGHPDINFHKYSRIYDAPNNQMNQLLSPKGRKYHSTHK